MESQNQVNLSVSMLDDVFEDGQKEELRKELKICLYAHFVVKN